MSCSNYALDTSVIDDEIAKIRDKNIVCQIKKKIKKVKANPTIGESKKYKINEERVVKVNGQRIVIFYHVDEEKCLIVFDLIDRHDQAYRSTY